MYYTKTLDHKPTTCAGSSSLGEQAQAVRLGNCGLVFQASYASQHNLVPIDLMIITAVILAVSYFDWLVLCQIPAQANVRLSIQLNQASRG